MTLKEITEELDGNPSLALAVFRHIEKMKLLEPWQPGIAGIHSPDRMERRPASTFPLTYAQVWAEEETVYGHICLPMFWKERTYIKHEYTSIEDAMTDIDRRLTDLGFILA